MRKGDVLNNQISIFDILANDNKEKEIIVKSHHIRKVTNKQQEIINKYYGEENITKIIHYCGGGIGIEFNNAKTHYFNSQGIYEFQINKSSILPADTILYTKIDEEITYEQLIKLQDFKEDEIIKRQGDPNILILKSNNVIMITPIGRVLEVNMKCSYKKEELKSKKALINRLMESLSIGDIIETTYGDSIIEGKIMSIYGPSNCTLNIIFDKKHTAIYRGSISKVLKKVA